MNRIERTQHHESSPAPTAENRYTWHPPHSQQRLLGLVERHVGNEVLALVVLHHCTLLPEIPHLHNTPVTAHECQKIKHAYNRVHVDIMLKSPTLKNTGKMLVCEKHAKDVEKRRFIKISS